MQLLVCTVFLLLFFLSALSDKVPRNDISTDRLSAPGTAATLQAGPKTRSVKHQHSHSNFASPTAKPPTKWNLLRKKERIPPKKGPRPSFQAQSYVHDDLPFLIMEEEDRHQNQPSQVLLQKPIPGSGRFGFKQTATVTEMPSQSVRKYIDENDEYLGLSKNEERVKIFYGNNPDLAPLELRRPGDIHDSPSPFSKMFNAFKTQRANYNVASRSSS